MVGGEDADEDQSQQSHTGGKLKQYINRKNEEAEDVMSNIATAHVRCTEVLFNTRPYYF